MHGTKDMRLSGKEAQLLAWAQMRELRCVGRETLQQALRLSSTEASKLLARMNRRGLIVQLQRGLYLLPAKLPPGGRWQPQAETALYYYLQHKEACWQETGPGAFQWHGLSEQMANVLTVYNDCVSDTRRFGKQEVRLIKVPANRLGHARILSLKGEEPVERRIGSLARVVFDAVYDHSRFGTLPRAYQWIGERAKEAGFVDELVACALEHGNVATCRRIGWVLDTSGCTGALGRATNRLAKTLRSTQSAIAVDPTRPARGKINRKWGVVENGA